MRLCVLTIREDDGSYVAICPSMPGCLSKGQTRQEAVANHRETVRTYLASATNFIPERVTFRVVAQPTETQIPPVAW